MSYSTGDREIDCAHSHYPGGWPEAISDGCPGALAALGERLGVDRVRDYYQSLGLYTQPALRMPVAEVASPEAVVDNTSAVALGEGLHVSPLQLARAAAILSADGVLPAPIIAEAYDSTEVGWKALAPLDSPRQVLAGGVASQAGRELALNDEYYWQSVSVAPFGADEALTWYLAGTVESTNGNAYLLVLILEEKAPDLALEIGRTMIDHLVSP